MSAHLHKWMTVTTATLHGRLAWCHHTIYNQSNTFAYIHQLEFAILESWIIVKEIWISLDIFMTGKLSINLIPPVMLWNILKNVTYYFPDGYSLCASLQQNNINLFYEFMDISVLAYHRSVKSVMLIPFRHLKDIFICTRWSPSFIEFPIWIIIFN